MKQSVKVSLLGQEFHLKSESSAEEVQRVARFVEEQISQVTSAGRAVDTMQAAILALFNVSATLLQGGGGGAPAPAPEISLEQLQSLADRIENALASDGL